MLKKMIDETVLERMTLANSPSFSSDGNWLFYQTNKANIEKNIYEKSMFCREMVTGEVFSIQPEQRAKFVLWNEENILYVFCDDGKGGTIIHLWDTEKRAFTKNYSAPAFSRATFLDENTLIIGTSNMLYKQNEGYSVITDTPFWNNDIGFTQGRRNGLSLYSLKTCETLVFTEKMRHVTNFCVLDGKIYYNAYQFENILSDKPALFCYDLHTKKTEQILPEKEYYVQNLFCFDDKLYFVGSKGDKFGRYEYGGFHTVNYEDKPVELSVLFDANVGVSAVTSDGISGMGAKTKSFGDDFYFISTQNEKSGIYKLNIHGVTSPVITDADIITSFAISEKGIAYVASYNGKASELYFAPFEENAKQLTCYNEFLQAEYMVSQAHTLSIKDSEGNTVNGWVLPPCDCKKGEKYPMVLFIHGGPRIALNGSFSHELQSLTARGYGVCYCNPIGSDSRGNEFGNLSGRYGEIDFEQIITFTKSVIEKFDFVDSSKLGIWGGSYGGYLVNWTIGHTDIFSAAISERSIANWITMETMSDIGAFYVPDQSGFSLFNDQSEQMWNNSPLKYAKNITTPTLFIHSECDYRCPREESFQMYHMLKRNGIDTKMLYFWKENHNLSRVGKPKNRIARIDEIINWFDEHM
ncbi:MAG: S9 family peptidase [Clostridia bacterium]